MPVLTLFCIEIFTERFSNDKSQIFSTLHSPVFTDLCRKGFSQSATDTTDFLTDWFLRDPETDKVQGLSD